MKDAHRVKTLGLLSLIFVFSFNVIAQDDGLVLRPGLYRVAGKPETCQISGSSSSSLKLSSWQTKTPTPPSDRNNFYNTGTATPIGDGSVWRSRNRDVSGYCCGNYVEYEFRILSPTSFQTMRWRYWPYNAPTPGPEVGWQAEGSISTLVGEPTPPPPPRSSSSEPPPYPAPPPPDRPDLKDSGARFSSMTGKVEVYHQGETWKDRDFAKLDTVLYVGDHIITSEESSTIVGFKDLSTFFVQEESEVVVTTPPENDSKIKLVTGNIWANIKKMVKDGTMEIEMSQAVTGIKGTRLILEEKPGTSTTKVIEGAVLVISKRTGQSVMVKAGYMVKATARGLGPVQTFVIPPEAAAWK